MFEKNKKKDKMSVLMKQSEMTKKEIYSENDTFFVNKSEIPQKKKRKGKSKNVGD